MTSICKDLKYHPDLFLVRVKGDGNQKINRLLAQALAIVDPLSP